MKPSVDERQRSTATITRNDLIRLGTLAEADLESLFTRQKETGRLYRGRLFAIALCQGAALHYIDGKTGIKDFDVWSFFRAHPQRPFPYRRNATADFGDAKFGKTPGSEQFVGRRVDLLGRSLQVPMNVDPVDALRTYLAGRGTATARHLDLSRGLVGVRDLAPPYADARASLAPSMNNDAWYFARVLASPARWTFSPRARGWTELVGHDLGRDDVFPACAGVDRARTRSTRSPSIVFPACAGVDRWTCSRRPLRPRFPACAGVDRRWRMPVCQERILRGRTALAARSYISTCAKLHRTRWRASSRSRTLPARG